jgi:RNA polymerase sigma-70 factor (ECF subfamily)
MSALVAMHAALRSWPELNAAPREFEAHVSAHCVSAADLELHGAELYLAFACGRGDRAALQVLERDYLAQTVPVIARVSGAAVFVDEVRQDLRERLLVGQKPRIAQYAATGSLGAWLRVSALRLALNHDKSQRNREELLVEAMVEPEAPERAERESHRQAVQQALRQAFGALSVRQRNVLRLHYVETLSIDQIGALYGAHRATAARWLGRAREQIFEQVAETVKRDLGLTASEVRSVLIDVRSQLEISVLRLLGSSQEPESRAGDA